MRLDWKLLAKRAKRPAAVVAFLLALGGAYWLGGVPPAESAPEPAPRAEEKGHHEPAPVNVPSSPAHARFSGPGGGAGNWVTGSVSSLGSEFKRSVAKQFGDGSLGQAHMAMAGLGFDCMVSRHGGLQCKKTMDVNNCTLTWSVRLEADGGGEVTGAGGEGFSRECH